MWKAGLLMVAPAVEGIDLFKIGVPGEILIFVTKSG